jgi:hypothetical protein
MGGAETHSAERGADAAGLAIGTLIMPRLVAGYDADRVIFGTFYGAALYAPAQDRLVEFATSLADEASVPGRFGGEPFERRAFDFGRKCFNACPLGGWGACAMETRIKQDECEGIAGRTILSAAARRAPLVRDVLKLVGSRSTALPTDVDAGLRLSTGLIRGGGTLGIEARW